MDKDAVNLDRATVDSVIAYMHQTLVRHGIDNRIALFGSFNNGNPHEDSDIDLIIVSKAFEGKDIFERARMTVQPNLEVMRKFVVPMDILTKTPDEYEDARAMFNAKIVI
ncbi:MAG: nucleotidyltransferase domain-containing protein [Prevotellaceae bacterium]|jgi:predicted nucleotidyltransferase|nr:nucleotidyltransferase domain-containing protein [Prevotellaceae bacterium]